MTEYESFAAAVRDLGVVSYHTALRRVRERKWDRHAAVSVPPFQDPERLFLPGMTFNFLTAIRRMPDDSKRDSRWLFLCKCGKQIVAFKKNVLPDKNGKSRTKSCGCLRKLLAQQRKSIPEEPPCL